MLPHALPSATWEFQGRGADKNGKEWFRGKDVCMILGFWDAKDALTKKVKIVYKSDLRALAVVPYCGTTSLSYNEGKAVYISEPDLYQLIFLLWLKLVDKIHLCYLTHCPVLHGILGKMS